MQIGAGHAGALQRGQRLAAVKARGVVHKSEDAVGQAQVFHDGAAHAAHRSQRQQGLAQGGRNKSKQRGVDKEVHGRRVRGAPQNRQQLAHAVALGVDQVKALARGPALVADDV